MPGTDDRTIVILCILANVDRPTNTHTLLFWKIISSTMKSPLIQKTKTFIQFVSIFSYSIVVDACLHMAQSMSDISRRSSPAASSHQLANTKMNRTSSSKNHN